MEVQHEDIQLAASCGVCGQADLEQDKKRKQQQLQQQLQQIQNFATGSTVFSWTNIIIFIILILLLLGAVYLLRRPSRITRRR